MENRLGFHFFPFDFYLNYRIPNILFHVTYILWNFAQAIPWNSAEVKTNSKKIPTSAEFQKSASIDTQLQTENGTNGKS
jgi:hypothetical protein